MPWCRRHLFSRPWVPGCVASRRALAVDPRADQGDAVGARRVAGSSQRLLDARLLLLHLDLGRRADADHRDDADQLRQPLLQLLTVVVRRRLLDLGADLLDAALDVGLLAGAVDDLRVVLVDDDALARPRLLSVTFSELDAELFGDDLCLAGGGRPTTNSEQPATSSTCTPGPKYPCRVDRFRCAPGRAA